MGEFSLTHWIIIAVIALLFFGPKRLPGLGQSLGESIRGFKKAMSDDHDVTPEKRRETIVSSDQTGSTPNTTSTSSQTKDPTKL